MSIAFGQIQSINSISIPKLIGSIDANSTNGDVTVYIDELSADKASSVVSSRGAAAVSLNPKARVYGFRKIVFFFITFFVN